MSSLTNLFKCVTHSYEDHPMTRFHGCTATWLIHICLLPKPSLIHTGCQRPIDCPIFACLWKLHTWALYLMADVRSGSFAKRDLQKEVSYGSWSSCEHTKTHTHTCTHTCTRVHTTHTPTGWDMRRLLDSLFGMMPHTISEICYVPTCIRKDTWSPQCESMLQLTDKSLQQKQGCWPWSVLFPHGATSALAASVGLLFWHPHILFYVCAPVRGRVCKCVWKSRCYWCVCYSFMSYWFVW